MRTLDHPGHSTLSPVGTVTARLANGSYTVRMDSGVEISRTPARLHLADEALAPVVARPVNYDLYVSPPISIRPGAEDAARYPSRIGNRRIWRDGRAEAA